MSDIAVTGMSIQLSIDHPHNILMHIGLDKGFTQDEVYKAVELLTNVVDREKLKLKLKEKKETHKSNQERLNAGRFERELVTLKHDIDRELEELRDQRNAFDQSVSLSWANSARRGERKLNGRQQQEMDNYDKLIVDKQQELNEKIRLNRKMKREFELGLPVTQWQIDCLYAELAGQPEPPMPEEVAANLKELEMPEDVSIPEGAFHAPPIAA